MTAFGPSAVRPFAAAVAVVLAMTAGPAMAQWKWRDASGHVQYSDLPPPPSTPEKDILAKPSMQQRAAVAASLASAASAPMVVNAASSALAPKTADPELEARRKKAEADQAAKVKADQDRVAAARADNCKSATSQYKTLESGIRLARTNDKGEREIIDDRQRAEELKRAQSIMSSDCK